MKTDARRKLKPEDIKEPEKGGSGSAASRNRYGDVSYFDWPSVGPTENCS